MNFMKTKSVQIGRLTIRRNKSEACASGDLQLDGYVTLGLGPTAGDLILSPGSPAGKPSPGPFCGRLPDQMELVKHACFLDFR